MKAALSFRLSPARLLHAAFLLALFILCARPVIFSDFWVHLSLGRLIVSSGAIPSREPFVWPQLNQPWIAHEWLSAVAIYLLFAGGGYVALIVAWALALTAALYLAYLRMEAHPLPAAVFTLLGALALPDALLGGVRPMTLSLLLASILLFLLDRYRQRPALRYLLPIVPLTAIWANLHASVPLAPLIVGAYLVGLAAERMFGRSISPATLGPGPLAAILALSLAAIALNPSGTRLYSYPFTVMDDDVVLFYIREWKSPDFRQVAFQPLAWLWLGLLAAGWIGRWRVNLPALILLIVFGYASLVMVRHTPYFVLIALPVLAARWSGAWQPSWAWPAAPRLHRLRPLACGLALLVLLLLAAWRVDWLARQQVAWEQEYYPAAAISYIEARPHPSNLFNLSIWGGYVTWRLYPSVRAYIDGRNDAYGGLFLERYLRTYDAQPGWQERLDRDNVNLVLLDPDAPLALAMRGSPRWVVRFADDHAVLFERVPGV